MKKLLIFTLIISLFLISPTLAAEEVEIGTYIINIGEYEIVKGSYVVDLYLWLRWNDTDIDPTNFEFMNGRAGHKELVIDEPCYKFYRIEAHLYEGANLKNYPLDSQPIKIEIEDKILTTEEIVYVVDTEEVGISPELSILDWDLGKSSNYVKIVTYENWEEDYYRYVHEIEIIRPISAMVKVLTPLLFVALTAWVCFFFPLNKLGEKLAVAGTALLSAVAFHIYLSDALPEIGYLTMADKFVISLYALLVFTIIGIVAVARHLDNDNHKQAEKTNKKYLMYSLVVPIITFLILLLI